MKFRYLYLMIFVLAIAACEDYTENYPVPDPSIVAKFSYTSSTGFDPPDTVHFTNESYVPDIQANVSYQWDFGDGNTSTDENPVHVYLEEGSFTISLTPIADVPNKKIESSQDIKLVKQLKGDTLFFENFDELDVLPSDWAVFNEDGGTVATGQAAFQGLNDSAWIVWHSNYFGSKVAVSSSWYTDDQLDSDNWMILPKVSLGENSILTWDAMSMTTSGNYPDSYQIRVSTTTQDVAGCLANSVLYRIIDEDWGEDVGGAGFQSRKVNLKKYANQDVYIAFRLNTPAPGGDRLGIDNIAIIEE